jgi:hypothetical protein
MPTINDILKFAQTHKVFTRKDLIKYLTDLQKLDFPSSISEQLDRLLKNGQIIRLKRGVYKLTENTKKDFLIKCSDEVKNLDRQIKGKLPFAKFCIWDSSVIFPYVRHIPNINFIYIDVEREVAESVFNLLNSGTGRRIFFMPTQTDFDRYISGNEAIIIRQLISEAPMRPAAGINTPAIEKILVDIAGDTEFAFLQGTELHNVYTNIFKKHNVNKKRLLRYAARRARRKEVEQLINTNKL